MKIELNTVMPSQDRRGLRDGEKTPVKLRKFIREHQISSRIASRIKLLVRAEDLNELTHDECVVRGDKL